MARDCDKALPKNIKKLESLRGYFHRSYIFVIENDSKDKTREILSDWKLNSQNVKVISFDTNSLTIPIATFQNPYPFSSFARTEKMARYRNIYMSEINKISPDSKALVLMIDIDILDFDPLRVIESVKAAPENWGGLFAYGCEWFHIFNFKFHPTYYDLFAFAENSAYFETPVNSLQMARNKKTIDAKISKATYFPCISAFGGLAIYKLESILGLSYQSIRNNDKEIHVRCEHIDFNRSVHDRGYHNYIAHNMWVDYGQVGYKTLLRKFIPERLFVFLQSLKSCISLSS
jgi:hypothetical protein